MENSTPGPPKKLQKWSPAEKRVYTWYYCFTELGTRVVPTNRSICEAMDEQQRFMAFHVDLDKVAIYRGIHSFRPNHSEAWIGDGPLAYFTLNPNIPGRRKVRTLKSQGPAIVGNYVANLDALLLLGPGPDPSRDIWERAFERTATNFHPLTPAEVRDLLLWEIRDFYWPALVRIDDPRTWCEAFIKCFQTAWLQSYDPAKPNSPADFEALAGLLNSAPDKDQAQINEHGFGIWRLFEEKFTPDQVNRAFCTFIKYGFIRYPWADHFIAYDGPQLELMKDHTKVPDMPEACEISSPEPIPGSCGSGEVFDDITAEDMDNLLADLDELFGEDFPLNVADSQTQWLPQEEQDVWMEPDFSGAGYSHAGPSNPRPSNASVAGTRRPRDPTTSSSSSPSSGSGENLGAADKGKGKATKPPPAKRPR
ncbi:hypothetical protein MMC27_007258 [Xylographa pallens]|nr:hypothetical protein [Xylographa pallens]